MPDPTNDFTVSPAPPCPACGGPAHGCVGAERACLVAHLEPYASRRIRELEAKVAELEAELRPHRELRAAVLALPPSWVEKARSARRARVT
jgi:hypothetical protein